MQYLLHTRSVLTTYMYVWCLLAAVSIATVKVCVLGVEMNVTFIFSVCGSLSFRGWRRSVSFPISVFTTPRWKFILFVDVSLCFHFRFSTARRGHTSFRSIFWNVAFSIHARTYMYAWDVVITMMSLLLLLEAGMVLLTALFQNLFMIAWAFRFLRSIFTYGLSCGCGAPHPNHLSVV